MLELQRLFNKLWMRDQWSSCRESHRDYSVSSTLKLPDATGRLKNQHPDRDRPDDSSSPGSGDDNGSFNGNRQTVHLDLSLRRSFAA
jgi:hypothetical protein